MVVSKSNHPPSQMATSTCGKSYRLLPSTIGIMRPFALSFLLVLVLNQTNSRMMASAQPNVIVGNQTKSPMMDPSQPDNIIVQACRRCVRRDPVKQNYSLCVESLAAVPESHHTDAKGLAIIALKLTEANMALVKTRVQQLLNARPPVGSRTRSSLMACQDVYSLAASNLKDAMATLKSGLVEEANVYVRSAVDAPVNCEDSFEEVNITSPLVEENKYLLGLAAIGRAMITTSFPSGSHL